MILFVLPHQKVQAQPPEKIALERLKAEGFEEIRILHEGTDVICTIEKGLYRTPAEDFRHTLFVLKSIFPDSSRFRILLLEQGQPVYQLSVAAQGIKNQAQDELKTDDQTLKGEITYFDENIYQRIKKETIHRPVHTGLTLTIYAQHSLRNNKFSQIYEKQFNLAPVLQYSGWKGMLLTGQIIFPLFNELGRIDDFIRPGFVTFSQNFSLPRLNSLRFTAGNFNKNSYGLDLRWKKHFQNSRWNLGANMGLTGRSYVYDRYWNHSALSRFSWHVKAGYYLPFYHVRADIQAGQFLANDLGFRGDVYRHFGEVTIGVYAGQAAGINWGGFHFAIPLDPIKRKHNHRLRIVLPATFDNEYNGSAEMVYGRYYEIRPDENRSAQDLHPKFINNIFLNP